MVILRFVFCFVFTVKKKKSKGFKTWVLKKFSLFLLLDIKYAMFSNNV